MLASIALVAMFLGLLVYLLQSPSRARAALPHNAVQIEEHYVDLFPDYIRVLTARIDEGDFAAFADRLELDQYYSIDPQSEVQWPSCDEAWWNPPHDLTGVRYQLETGTGSLVMAVYHKGHVYFAATSW